MRKMLTQQNKIILDQPRMEGVQGAIPQDGGQELVGSWQLTISPSQGTPAPGLATFGIGGIVVTSTLVVEPALGALDRVIFISTGHGAWEANGQDTASLTLLALATDGQGRFDSAGVIHANLTLGSDGQTFSGSYMATIADPTGNTVATEQGTLQATRIIPQVRGILKPDFFISVDKFAKKVRC
jgi:hypothetical protein